MNPFKNSWGIFPFIFALFLVFLPFVGPQYIPLSTINHLSTLAIIFSVLLAGLGFYSWSKIHEAKFFVGSIQVSLLTLLALFLKEKNPWDVWLVLMYLSVLLNMVIPASLKYGQVRGLGIIWLLVILGTYGWVYTSQYSSSLPITRADKTWEGIIWVGILFSCLILMISLKFLRNQHHIGGIWAGLGLLPTAILISHYFPKAFPKVTEFLLAVMPFFVLVGLIWYWLKKVHHQITYDPLLQIYNRDTCQKIISGKSKLNISPPFSLAMVDIDHFKKVNDTYGHQAGDEVLKEVASTVQAVTGKHGVVCRYGGEEMAVFLPKVKLKQAEILMEKVRQAVAKKRIQAGNKKIKVTVSSGVAQKEQRGQNIEQLLEIADKALYRAKRNGRDQVCTGKIPIIKR